jgi:hypothetical protein
MNVSTRIPLLSLHVRRGNVLASTSLKKVGRGGAVSSAASPTLYSNNDSNSKTYFSTGGGGASGFETVGCVGLGLMGHGICQVAASSGVHSKVIAYEKEQKFLDAG